jgi:5-(carboxyamino)imidazole ribonucleotide mutase
MPRIDVAILMGSDSDLASFAPAFNVLKDFGVSYEVRVLSAHRSPSQVRAFVEHAPKKGVRVFIAGAGGAAHLAGVVASHTSFPVIGVPIETKSLKGLDSLLSTVQMPKGVPVATVAIGNSANAALLAVQILSIKNAKLQKQLTSYKKSLARQVLKADGLLQKRMSK